MKMNNEVNKIVATDRLRQCAMNIAVRGTRDYESFMAVSDLFYNYLSQGVDSQLKHSIRKEYTLRKLSLEMACEKGTYTNLDDVTKVAERCYKYLIRLVNCKGQTKSLILTGNLRGSRPRQEQNNRVTP